MPNSDHSVAVVLLNWNKTFDTLACVDSVRSVKHPNFTIVIVDNHSRPAEYEKLKSGSKNSVILRQSRNRGFSGGCNAGIRWALRHGFQYVWLLNADTVVDPNSLSELVRAIESDPSIAIAGGVIYSSANPNQIQTAGGFIDPETQRGEMLVPDQVASEDRGIRDVDYVSGAMLLVRSEAVRKVGLLDERFFMYYEDTDWGIRMRERGWRVVATSAARIWHKDKESAGAKKPYFLQHGYFMFLYKNFPDHLPRAMRLYARHYLRPHVECRQWRLAWADAKVYLNLFSRLAFVRANIHP